MGLVILPRIAAVLLLSAVGAVWLLAWSRRMPDIDVRSVPRTTQHGLVWRDFAPGQGFVCAHDGLRSIEVECVRLSPEGGQAPDLVLRDGGPEGAELRHARGELASDERETFVRFEFEPLADSGGRALHFQLVPPDGAQLMQAYSPFVRYRGAPSLGRPWGDRVVGPERLEGELLSENPDLRGIALAMEGVDAAAGAVELELWLDEDAQGAPLRVARLQPPAPLARGWAFFGFEPLLESRWRRLRYRLRVPPGAQPVGSEQGLSYWTFHGNGKVDPRLLGMSVGRLALADRDLIFRAWSAPPRLTAWRLALARAGWRLPVGALLWMLALAGFVALLPRPRAAAR